MRRKTYENISFKDFEEHERQPTFRSRLHCIIFALLSLELWIYQLLSFAAVAHQLEANIFKPISIVHNQYTEVEPFEMTNRTKFIH